LVNIVSVVSRLETDSFVITAVVISNTLPVSH
jgi:hypothetical protein